MTDGRTRRVRPPAPNHSRAKATPTSDDVRAHDSRLRLKSRRTELGLTPEELATRIGKSPSTVRAHENGQNKITADMADLYSSALGVSPSWLLWGNDFTQPILDAINDTTTPIPIYLPIKGEISGSNPSNEKRAQNQTVHVYAPEYHDFPLVAYIVRDSKAPYRRGDYLVTAPLDVGIREGDQIVVETIRDGQVYNSLHLIEWGASGLHLRALSSTLGRLGADTLPEGVVARAVGAKGEPRVQGVVVAYGGRDRPASTRVIRPERLAHLRWLT